MIYLVFCSRNWEFKTDETNLYSTIAKQYNIEEKLRELGRNIAIQGEIIGPGISKNPEKLNDKQFFVFDIYDIDKQEYLNPRDRIDLAVQKLHLQHVPLIGIDQFLQKYPDNDSLLEFSNGKSLNAKVRECLVFKNINNPSISFKVINNKYLLKQKD